MSEEVRHYLEAVDEHWRSLVESGRVRRRRVGIAGSVVDVVVGGDRLADILFVGFECHPDASGHSSATVGAWDAEETGHPLPPVLRDEDPLVRQWMVRRDGRPTAEVWWTQDLRTIGVGNRYTARHLLGVASTELMSPWEAGAPLRRQLWWALGRDALFVHAGAVGDEDGVVLLMGASGAGKSTTSVACALAGMKLLADDYCLLRGDPYVAHLLHATARLRREEVPAFSDYVRPVNDLLGPHAGDPEMKALLLPHRDAPETVLRSAPVRAVVMTEPAGLDRPLLEPVSPPAALRELAPSALKQMHLDAHRELAGLRRLLTSVPVHRLRLARDRRANPEVIRDVLNRTMTTDRA